MIILKLKNSYESIAAILCDPDTHSKLYFKKHNDTDCFEPISSESYKTYIVKGQVIEFIQDGEVPNIPTYDGDGFLTHHPFFYLKDTKRSINTESDFSDNFFQKLVELSEINKTNTHGLVVGCGNGYFLKFLYTKYFKNKNFGLDVNFMPNFYSSDPIEFIPIRATGAKLPFKTNSLDWVLFESSLHHIPQRSAALHEAYRVLKPGGSIVLFEPNGLHPHRVLCSARWIPKKIVQLFSVEFHTRQMSLKSNISKLKDSGFTLDKFFYISPEYKEKTLLSRIQKYIDLTFPNCKRIKPFISPWYIIICTK